MIPRRAGLVSRQSPFLNTEDAMKRIALAPVLCVLAASSLVAFRPVPFRASFETRISIPAPCGPTCAIDIAGEGQAAHMGRASLDGPSLINFLTGSQTGTSTLTAADGSQLEIAFQGSFSPISPTDVTFSGSWTAIAGTGRFADADGSGAYQGTASLATNVGELHLDGLVSDTGRH
jgi:hypothetical protein